MSDRVSERSLIRAFFNFDEIIERPRWMSFAQLIQLGVILAGFIWASVREREDRPDVTGYNLLEGLLAACILLVATSIIIFIAQLIYKAIVRLARNRRRAHLEKVTKAKLKSDYRRALKALLAASGLKPGQLSTVDRAEPCQFEQSLFSDAELDAFLGPLRDQTFRAVTPHGTQVKFAGSGKHHLSGQNFFDGYYGPFRVTCVFFTPDAFIIGECICDPFTGDLQKRIRTVLRSSIQTADFRTHLRTVPISQPILDDWLDNRRLDQEEHHRIRTILAKHKNTQATARRYGQNLPALPFAFEQKVTYLDLTRENKNQIILPVRLDQTLVRTSLKTSYLDEQTATASPTTAFGELSTFRSDQAEAEVVVQTAERRQVRALWSSGRQAIFREYSAFWPFVRSILFAGGIALCTVWFMNVLAEDESVRFGSSHETPARLESSGAP